MKTRPIFEQFAIDWPSPIVVRKCLEISYIDFRLMVQNDLYNLCKDIYFGDIFIVRKAIDSKSILKLREKIFNFGITTESLFHKISEGVPNFHQIVDENPKFKILMRSHNFHFFHWNKDQFGIFPLFGDILKLFQIISGYHPDYFNDRKPSSDLVTRLQIHHYPSGGGYMSSHQDPSQFVKAFFLTCMSSYNLDYFEGGLYVLDSKNNKLFLDPKVFIGDLILGYPTLIHGVQPIDPTKTLDWNSIQGRWMFLFNNLQPARIKESSKASNY
tara:strand:- start:47 stop:859 length:813 start_codon:yes stop_codon:yes gene_type:complete